MTTMTTFYGYTPTKIPPDQRRRSRLCTARPGRKACEQPAAYQVRFWWDTGQDNGAYERDMCAAHAPRMPAKHGVGET